MHLFITYKMDFLVRLLIFDEKQKILFEEEDCPFQLVHVHLKRN